MVNGHGWLLMVAQGYFWLSRSRNYLEADRPNVASSILETFYGFLARAVNYSCEIKHFFLDCRIKSHAAIREGRLFTVKSYPSECGGIGRRTGFRFQRRKAWGFESLLSHQMVQTLIDQL